MTERKPVCISKGLPRPGEIHRDIPVMQRGVKELDVLAQAEMLVGLHRLLQRPIVIVAVENAGAGGGEVACARPGL